MRENSQNKSGFSVKLDFVRPESYRKFLTDDSILSEMSFDEENFTNIMNGVIQTNSGNYDKNNKSNNPLTSSNFNKNNKKNLNIPKINPISPLFITKLNQNPKILKKGNFNNLSPISKNNTENKLGETLNIKNNNFLNNFNDKIESQSDSGLSQLSQIYPYEHNSNNILNESLESNTNKKKLNSEMNIDKINNIKINKKYEQESISQLEKSKVSFGNNKNSVIYTKKKVEPLLKTNSNNINKIKKVINTNNEIKNIKNTIIKSNNEGENSPLSIFTDHSRKVKKLKKELNKNKKDLKISGNSKYSSMKESNIKIKKINKKVKDIFVDSHEDDNTHYWNGVNSNMNNQFNQMNYPYSPYMIPIGMSMQYPMMNPQLQMSQMSQMSQITNFNPYLSVNSANYNIPLNTQMTRHSNYNSNQTQYLLTDSDPNSCNYCEEIYKYTIMNNIPLKVMTCLYCNKIMNAISLEFYIRKFKEDLELQFKKTIDENLMTNQNQENSQSYEEESSNSVLDKISHNSDDYKNNINSTTRSEKNVEIRHERKISEDLINTKLNRNKEESVNMILDTTDTVMSIAEIFKQRRAQLLTKMEKRTYSVKDTSRNKSAELIENLEMKNISKILTGRKKESNINKINLDLNSIKEEKKKTIPDFSKTEPSADLVDRLIHGKKAKMSIKEMKELNQRLYKKLVEVKYRVKDDSKKNEYLQRTEKKKKYTDNLKNLIVNSMKIKNISNILN